MSRRSGSTPDAEVATLRRYLKEIARYPPLNHEQEIELATRIQAGCTEICKPAPIRTNSHIQSAAARGRLDPNPR